MAVRQEPSSASSAPRSAATQRAVGAWCSAFSQAAPASAARHLDGQRALAGRGRGGRRDRAARRSRPARPSRFRPARASTMRVGIARVELGQAGVDVAAQHARSAGPAGGAAACAWRRRLAVPMRAPCGRASNEAWLRLTKASRGSSRSGMAAMTRPGGRLGRHVLHRVHRAVDAAVEQRLLDLLGEQPLAADLEQAAVLHAVAGGGDEDERRDLVLGLGRRRRARRRSSPASWPAWVRASWEARVPMRTGGCKGGKAGATSGTRPPGYRSAGRPAMMAFPTDRSNGPLTVLGLETSCDETAAAVVRRFADGRVEVLSSIVASQIAAHAPFGGVVPEMAARAHVEIIDAHRRRGAGRGRRRLRATCTASRPPPGPGLVGGVMVGLSLRQGDGAGARPAADRGQPPGGPRAVGAAGGRRAPIRSCCCWSPAAIASCWRSRASARCRRLGSTIDDAAGEAFDKIAKALGLRLSRAARRWSGWRRGGDPSRFPLPRALLGPRGLRLLLLGPEDRRGAAGRGA